MVPIDQMAVAAKDVLRFETSRHVKRFEDTNENILALHSRTRCSSDIAHR
jgi:hypothetical protein